jgi:hypothetical protein
LLVYRGFGFLVGNGVLHAWPKNVNDCGEQGESKQKCLCTNDDPLEVGHALIAERIGGFPVSGSELWKALRITFSPLRQASTGGELGFFSARNTAAQDFPAAQSTLPRLRRKSTRRP